MLCRQLLGRHRLDALVGQTVSEAPVILRADITFAGPLVITPPHRTQRKKLLDLVRVVGKRLLRIVGIVVVRIRRIGHRSLVIVRIGVLDPAAAGVMARVAVVKQQRLAVPIEPQVRIALLLVYAVIEILHDSYHGAVEGPETKLWNDVALGLHLLHRREDNLPLVPITHGIRHIHYEHIDTGIGQHRHILAYDPLVLTQEIPHLGLGVVVRPHSPERMVGIQTRRWIGLQNLRHITPVWRGHIGQSLRVPRDVEYADHTAMAILEATSLLRRRHRAAYGVGSDPRVGIEVTRLDALRLATPLGIGPDGKKTAHGNGGHQNLQ